MLELVDSKVEGKEIIATGPPVQRAQVIDLMESLKESLAKHAPAEKKPPVKVARRAEAKAEPAPARRAQGGRK